VTDGEVQPQLLSGRYRMDGLLGRGGMSEVHYGYDERLDRRVAIKLLKPSALVSLDGPEATELLDQQERDRKRFLREIRTTAQLEHPGIPAVYDTGVETGADGSQRLWLVMQLLAGSTLEAILDRTDYESDPPSVEWAAAITAQIAAVLTDVHRLEIVHRDIKPPNVMIVDGGLVKVLDFGIAILRGAGAPPRLTQVDRTVGTPAYMSPEQSLAQAIASASDIYSLGCLLFELLTGDTPFFATTSMSLRAQHVQSPAPLVGSKRAGLPTAVEELVASMLSKDAHARPSADEVYSALAPLASAPSVPAPGHDESRDPTRPFRRPLLGSPRRRERTPVSGTPLTDPEAKLLEESVQALLENDQAAQAIRLLEDAIGRVRHDAALTLHLRHQLAAALFIDGEYGRAAALYETAGKVYARYRDPSDQDVLDCEYHAGHAFAQIGKPEKALPHLRFYVRNADAPPDTEETRMVLESRFLIAQMLYAVGDAEDALDEFEAIRPELADVYGTDSNHIRNLDKQVGRLKFG
jgi:serine/threonine protein kinase